MAEQPDLSFIAQLLERVLAELRDTRSEQRFIREEFRAMAAALERQDTITMDVLARIRRLEDHS